MITKDTVVEKIPLQPFEAFSAMRTLPMPFIFQGGHGDRRYTYAGACPSAVLMAREGRVTVNGKASPHKTPFEAMVDMVGAVSPQKALYPFSGGLSGYLAYDLKDYMDELRGARRPHGKRIVPDAILGLYTTIYVYDHEEKAGYLLAHLSDTPSLDAFDRIKGALSKGPFKTDPRIKPAMGLKSNFTREGYIEAVGKAKEYISSGDIYQINLSQALELDWEGDPYALFLAVQEKSPSPYGAYFDFGDFKVISSSPERLLKVEGSTAETSPIKGTRPRGATSIEDRTLATELLGSPKERAEHVMIVDLERNDLGRVCVPGSIRVESFEAIETLPGLHHMVSTVRGSIRPGVGSPACLRALFPGGSVTGAPKIRAMEIIDEIEKTPRGLYTGAIGWIGGNLDMDMAMAIRTAVCIGQSIYLHVGGGIVADSVPEDEYEETLLKARGFLDALGVS